MTPHLTSGHQPSFFHPGILAKRIALEKRAEAEGLDKVWLVADQDANEPGQIIHPDLDRSGALVRRTWQIVPTRPGVPCCARPVDRIAPPPRLSPKLPEMIQEGLDRIHRALVEAPGETVAERWAAANENLFSRWCASPVRLLQASRLLVEPQGRRLAERIAEDPIGCARVWNESVALVPRSARALRVDSHETERTEVPFWTLDPDTRQRSTATAVDLRRELEQGGSLLPKAFLMTAIVRSDGCLNMIHGTGGGRYEQVTEAWASRFLGVDLAPVSVVTATVRLPLNELAPGMEGQPSADDLRQLIHDPWSDAMRKRSFIEAIEKAPRSSPERLDLYRSMQEARQEECVAITERLDALERRIETGRDALAAFQVAEDRTWPWPLHENAAMDALFAATD